MVQNIKIVNQTKIPIWKKIKLVLNDLIAILLNDPLTRIKFIPAPKNLKNISNKPKDQLARAGEKEAEIFLINKNYNILQKNIRFQNGEIDIIAKDKNTLVFVEVKTRRSIIFGKPYEAVTKQKQKRLHKLANQFIKSLMLKKINYRIDVVSIVWKENTAPEITHIKNI
ncbi:MAG: YraN family protein [Planctomycetaceae bacterium]|jgi:putative endonuclease|nr:YraN family protein [Planctomycetaceae bacterium]